MNWLMKKIDLFCYKHPRFGIPNLMLYIVIGNAAVWLFTLMDTTGSLVPALYFSPALILKGQIWRLITFMIVPNSSGFWAILFFYFYYMIGRELENQWGPGRFTIYFFSGVLLTIIFGFVLYWVTGVSYSVDAQFIYLSMFFSFATLFPDTQVLLFFFLPIKMKWLAIADAAFFLYAILTSSFPLNLLPLVGVLNYLIFCGDMLWRFMKPASRRQRQESSNFKREIRRIRYEEENRPYKRRCEVCGRTDADYPNLEFRYCSRCQGYHCFCIDHINNHRHFTD